MKSHRGFSVLARLTTAGLLVLTTGTAVSIAADGADTSSSESASKSVSEKQSTRRVASKSGKSAKAVKSEEKAPAKAERKRRGVVQPFASMSSVSLRDPNMSVSEAIRLAQLRAIQVNKDRLSGVSPVPGALGGADNRGSGGGRSAVVPGSSGNFNNSGDTGEPWTWDNGSDYPGMGAGVAECRTTDYTEGTPGDRSFVNTSTIRRWPELPLSFDAPDLDGDGQPEDPISQRPTVIYYAFLEDSMIDFDWDGGDDNLNQIGLPTEDTNEDGVIDLSDAITPGETDDIADTWTEPGVVVDIIPPPDPDANLDPLVLLALDRMGLGPWSDTRPVFRAAEIHPDAEAVWRLYQRTFNPFVEFRLFEDTFDGGLVLDADERQLFHDAFVAIESVCNVVFIERADEVPDGGLFLGYPFAPQGYTGDPTGVVVDPGAFFGGLPGDTPGNPDDDYPWILITKENTGNFATEIGARRNNLAGPSSIDYFPMVDLDGDGFPDTPDLSPAGAFINGNPDQIILSSFGVPFDAIILDINGDGVVDANDSSIAVGVLDIALNSDANADLVPDILIDVDSDGNPAVVGFLPTADTNGDGSLTFADASDLQYDFNGDLVGDSVFGNSFASPVFFPFETVPCERLNVTEGTLGDENVATLVHEIMHHMGFNHEHQRPDRETFVHVNIENVAADEAGQFTILPGGPDRYANFVDNFDTATTPLDPTASPPYSAPIGWEVSSGTPAATSGVWDEQDPSLTGNSTAESPLLDYAVDAQDMSLECWVTGAGADENLDGVTILTSPDFDPSDAGNLRGLYGPDGAIVRFAYWVASDQAGGLDNGDGLLVEYSTDNRSSWTTAAEIRTNEAAWREAEFTIDIPNPDVLMDPQFHIRFTASDLDPQNQIEVGIDRVRVQNPYDFESIMHYGTYAFSIGDNPETPEFETILGLEVIEVRPPNDDEFQPKIGQSNGLSDGDRLALMNVYGAPADPIDGSNGEPCRADVNDDGEINNFDLMLFLEWFNAGDPRADFAPEDCVDTNGDSVIDINDDTSSCLDVFDMIQFFIDYQNRFECISGGDPLGFNNFGDVNPN